LGFLAAALTESKDFDQRLRQIKAARELPAQPPEINKIAFDILHRLAAGAHKVVMRVEVAVDAQGGTVRTDLAEQAVLDEEADILVNRGERHGRNAAADVGVDLLGGIVSGGSYDGLVDDMALVRRSKAELPGKVAKLDVGYAHGNWMRMIIIRFQLLSCKAIDKYWKKGKAPKLEGESAVFDSTLGFNTRIQTLVSR
jgi:hypothetical protein